ncbi:hypothetical protein PBT90_12680 [Algoriphagus halophytocola]|uniref:Uncharacterized protein n=1 Tax=Algoriphagus halophytocola TaxID=2991499 RepID=A0ABY6MKF0_9BACT|nr:MULTISPECIES: hypothetical protein [unclassified Algoriphagus]UZD24240.1 hypothetical protein OM944_07005 [Algoriphagus sp. TR-M5]WBL41609.1 hypothetical protein PBT90_12680 [Algoriphagus sp. TR-M9]
MKFFYLSSKPNSEGAFEIHDRECEHIPDLYERDYLGPYNSSKEALRKAASIRPKAKACDHCCGKVQDYVIKTSLYKDKD